MIAAAPPPSHVHVRDALGVARRRPDSIQFSVNPDLVGNSLRWHGWGSARAGARGWFTERPTRSQHTATLRGTVVLSRIVRCGPRRFYTRAKVTFDQPSKAPFRPRVVLTPC